MSATGAGERTLYIPLLASQSACSSCRALCPSIRSDCGRKRAPLELGGVHDVHVDVPHVRVFHHGSSQPRDPLGRLVPAQSVARVSATPIHTPTCARTLPAVGSADTRSPFLPCGISCARASHQQPACQPADPTTASHTLLATPFVQRHHFFALFSELTAL